jgi:hypothetical protein
MENDAKNSVDRNSDTVTKVCQESAAKVKADRIRKMRSRLGAWNTIDSDDRYVESDDISYGDAPNGLNR